MVHVSADPALPRSRVGLIATLLSTRQSYRGAGLHTYSYQLLRHLPSEGRRLDYAAFVNDPDYVPPAGVVLHRASRWSQRPALRIAWEQAALPLAARRQEVDLLHGLAYVLPLAAGMPGVVTVHDLTFRLFPEAFAPGNRLYLSTMTAASCRRARRIIAVSQATADDVEHLLHIPRERIDVVYNGVDDSFAQKSRADVDAFRREAGWPERFILSVGTIEPRKNYMMLLDAYALYRQRVTAAVPLLIGGGRGWDFEAVFSHVAALALEPHVRFLGFVPGAVLPWLYSAASLFVYPSFYEGFGLPLAEAMACGVPAITTTASSLPEVAGSAAITVNPQDAEALAAAMVAVLKDSDRQEAMRRAGLAQSERFRWPVAVAATAAVYERALGR
jgi:glycosyltransferase involved in cell wall biosynthesis